MSKPTAEAFAEAVYQEKERYLAEIQSPRSQSAAAALIRQMDLPPPQHAQLAQLLDTALTDLLTTLLYGLDGAAALGSLPQQNWRICDENGQTLAECGELEAAAYARFHGNG